MIASTISLQYCAVYIKTPQNLHYNTQVEIALEVRQHKHYISLKTRIWETSLEDDGVHK